jgi:AAA family ATP:ADP antiporter
VTSSRATRTFARALALFARVEPGEVGVAAAMTLIVFVLMCGYYLLKTAREPLILLQWGAEAKLYAESAQAVLLLGVVRLYSALARRVDRMRLLAVIYLFFASNMVVFAVLARAHVSIGLAFFLWVGIFSYTTIAQFWAFAADIYTEEQGKRLFALVGVGSSVGSVAGSVLARSLAGHGPHVLMAVAAVLVVLCVVMLAWVDRRSASTSGDGSRRLAPAAEPGAEGQLELLALLRDRYLVLIAALTLSLNCVSGLGDYILDRTLLAHVAAEHTVGHAAEAYVASFKATFFAWYNGLGVALQLFAVSRILVRFGVRGGLVVLPVVAIVGYGAYALVPLLAVAQVVVIANRALDYSLTNTARHALFLVASRAEKYVGKTFVDTVAARTGDLISAAVVFFGKRAGIHTPGFALVCVAVACAWLMIVMAISNENGRRLGLSAPGALVGEASPS